MLNFCFFRLVKCGWIVGGTFLLLFLVSVGFGATPNSLFSDGMVLQRDKPMPVWGVGRNGEKVTVTLCDRTASALVENGVWKVILPPLRAGGPFELKIEGEETLLVRDVMIGEVWICCGQSNMERQLGPRPPQPPIENWQEEVASANFPAIREFSVPQKVAPLPAADSQGKWIVCTPETVGPNFSAVGFFFVRALHQKLQVPVGIIFAARGGSAVEDWISEGAFLSNPETAEIVTGFDKALVKWKKDQAEYVLKQPELEKAYAQELARTQQAGLPAPRKPQGPSFPYKPSRLYNAMIAPLIPYAIRGVAFYQGEANSGRGKQYRSLLPLLIADWRQRFDVGSFPFLFVQLPPCPRWDPEVREAQLMTFNAIPNTAMVGAMDVGDADPHPPKKRPIGERLALAARAIAYGEKIEYSGPIFASTEFNQGQAIVHFTHVAGGLTAKDGPLRGFEIAGANQEFVPAQAEIVGENVRVSSTQVTAPVAVRYGWANAPDVNLFNTEGLPASPFRTDSAH